MSYSIHTLDLKKPIRISTNLAIHDGTVALIEFASDIKKNDLEPPKSAFAHECKTELEEIPPGTYFFTQLNSFYFDDGEKIIKQVQEGSEQLWLESIWKEVSFKNNRILVRILEEDGEKICQIFREIEK